MVSLALAATVAWAAAVLLVWPVQMARRSHAMARMAVLVVRAVTVVPAEVVASQALIVPAVTVAPVAWAARALMPRL
jgi:hypothetical protein